MVYSTDRSNAVVSVLVLLFVALWFILRSDLFYVLPCVILFLCFSVLLALRLSRLGKRELILVLFVRLFDLYLFGFVGFLFLLVSGKGCGLWLWHSVGFSLTFFSTFEVVWCEWMKNINKVKEMPQSRSKAFLRYRKTKSWRKYHDKANATHETTDPRSHKRCVACITLQKKLPSVFTPFNCSFLYFCRIQWFLSKLSRNTHLLLQNIHHHSPITMYSLMLTLDHFTIRIVSILRIKMLIIMCR